MAEDVLQTCYLKVLEGRARFGGRSSFRTWLFSVIRHTARDHQRSPWHWRRRQLGVLEEAAAPQTPVEADPRLENVARALQELPRRQSQVLSLVYGHGLTLREVAGVLAISQGSAATHLHRGKLRLRDRLATSQRREER